MPRAPRDLVAAAAPQPLGRPGAIGRVLPGLESRAAAFHRTVRGTVVNGRRLKLVGGLTVALTVIAGLGATGAAAAPGTPGGPRYTAGATGAGDAYFPYAGNGGYDVQHYDLDVTYTPPAPGAPLTGQLQGTATIDLIATQDLDRFNLDLRDMEV